MPPRTVQVSFGSGFWPGGRAEVPVPAAAVEPQQGPDETVQDASTDPAASKSPTWNDLFLTGSDRRQADLLEAASGPIQTSLFDDEADRRLIDELISATELYNSSAAFVGLIDFVSQLRAFAPFNATLLHIQKPGLTHAATARDWKGRFGRHPKRDARPLVVLRTMGPVDFVYDVLDTEGRPLPEAAFAFPALGKVTEEHWSGFVTRLEGANFQVDGLDAGDGRAGYVHLLERSVEPKRPHRWRVAVNRNHPPVVRFVTLAHELAHMFLGHLGDDEARHVRDRHDRSHTVREVEAETVAYLVARRNGVTPRSESYLTTYKGGFRNLDFYTIMRAAGAVEQILGLAARAPTRDRRVRRS